MRWTPKNPKQWRRWFAWHPIDLDGRRVWLEWVETRLVCTPFDWELYI